MALKGKLSTAKKGAKKGLSKSFNERTVHAGRIAFDVACFGLFASAAASTGGLLPVIWGAGAVLSACNAAKNTKKYKKNYTKKKLEKRFTGDQ